MERKIISTDRSPQPFGVYSQAVAWDRLIFVSGQVGADPVTRERAGDEVRAQTRQALRNVSAVLEAGGAHTSTVLKTTCYLADINDFDAFNKVYREFFPSDPPARSTIQAKLVPPWLVEIEAIAVRRGS